MISDKIIADWIKKNRPEIIDLIEKEETKFKCIKCISLATEHHKWIKDNNINLSKYVRELIKEDREKKGK